MPLPEGPIPTPEEFQAMLRTPEILRNHHHIRDHALRDLASMPDCIVDFGPDAPPVLPGRIYKFDGVAFIAIAVGPTPMAGARERVLMRRADKHDAMIDLGITDDD